MIVLCCMFAVRNWRLEAANHMGSCYYVSYLQTNVCYTHQPKMSVCVHAMSETTAPKLVAWGWSLTDKAAVRRLVSQLSLHVLA